MLNSQYIHSSLTPWCLLAGIREYGGNELSASVVESNINADMEGLLCELSEKSPDIVGFCCYIWNIDKVLPLCRALKERLPECTVVLGGPEVSYNARDVLAENSFVDFVISGEGEKPFATLCRALAEDDSALLKSTSGLCFRDGDEVIVSEPNVECDEPASPYTEEYFASLGGKISYMESSRGCPFSCAFCLSGRCGSVRFFDMERTKENLLLLANSGTKTVKFVDRTFNANPKRAIEIWQFIKENYGKTIPCEVCVHFEIAADILTEECLSVLSEMPCGSIQLEIGIQSFNEKTLDAIHRKTNLARVCDNVKRLASFGNMHLHTDLIAGLPYEDFGSFRDSFNRAFSLGADMLQLGFLKILHGSPMGEGRDEYPCEYSENAPYEVISTPWLTAEDITKLKLVDTVNDRISNSGRFSYSLCYALERCGMTSFDAFLRLGEFIGEGLFSSMALFDFAKLYFDFFSDFDGIDKVALADKMICDFFSHSRYGKLPPFLKRQNPKIKRVLEYLAKNPETEKPKNAVRAAAILESEGVAVFCDSGESKKDDVHLTESGRYRLRFVELSDIFDM
ncbi:MAG: DUF4080 domain-containing protein [Clostridia bacterium]|nr:DUF4080 domain-containing protein [Clostridia bacterium]